jgi:hypothetical protein
MIVDKKLLISAVMPACLVLQAALTVPVFGEEPYGGIGGITRDSATGQPVAQTQITAHNVEKNTDRTASSGADGAFSIANIEPGKYEVHVTKDGFQKSSVQVDVAARQTAQLDLKLQVAAAPLTEREKQLLERVERLEARLAAIEAKDAGATETDAKNAPQNRSPSHQWQPPPLLCPPRFRAHWNKPGSPRYPRHPRRSLLRSTSFPTRYRRLSQRKESTILRHSHMATLPG